MDVMMSGMASQQNCCTAAVLCTHCAVNPWFSL